MLSRALITATVTLLIGGFAVIPVQAENLEAGKSPSQIFAGTCSACHKGTRGLLKTVSPGSLPGFLRQHYTTSSDMAGVLSAYVLSNGATDSRGGGLTKQGQELTGLKPAGTPEQAETRPGRKPRAGAPAQEAAKPDSDGLTAPAEPGAHRGRNAKRLNPEADRPAADGQPGAATASDTGPAAHGSAKQRLGKRGKPGREEPPKPDAAKDTAKTEPAREEPAKSEPVKSEAAKVETAPATDAKTDAKPDTSKSETTRTETGKTEGAKPEAGKPEAGKEANKSETPLRADPVPLVTPAPKPPEGEAKPAQTVAPAPQPSSPTPSSSASVSPPSGTSTEPPAAPAPAVKPSVQASAPPPAPVPPAGPPAPPISQ